MGEVGGVWMVSWVHGFIHMAEEIKAREEQGSQCVNNTVGENGFMNSIVRDVLNGA